MLIEEVTGSRSESALNRPLNVMPYSLRVETRSVLWFENLSVQHITDDPWCGAMCHLPVKAVPTAYIAHCMQGCTSFNVPSMSLTIADFPVCGSFMKSASDSYFTLSERVWNGRRAHWRWLIILNNGTKANAIVSHYRHYAPKVRTVSNPLLLPPLPRHHSLIRTMRTIPRLIQIRRFLEAQTNNMELDKNVSVPKQNEKVLIDTHPFVRTLWIITTHHLTITRLLTKTIKGTFIIFICNTFLIRSRRPSSPIRRIPITPIPRILVSRG